MQGSSIYRERNRDLLEKIIICSRKRMVLINFFVSLLMLLLIEGFGIDSNLHLFLIYSLWQLFVWGYILISEFKYNGLNIFSILILGTVLSFAFPSLSCSIDLLNNVKIYYEEMHNISDFVFHTSVALNIYFSLFILLLTFFTKGELFIIDINELARRLNLFYVSIGLYLVAAVLRMVPFLELFSSTLASLGASLPMLVLLLLAVYCGFNSKHDKYYRLFIILVIVEVAYHLFFGFYKGPVIKTFAMYLLYYFLNCRNKNKNIINVRSFMLLTILLVFILYIVYPFMSLRRAEAGFGANSILAELPKVDNLKLMERVLTFDYNTDMLSEKGNSSAFSDRMSSIGPATFFYRDAYKKGYHTELIRHSIQGMVPRFMSPNKLNGSAGAMAVSYAREGYFDPDYNTAEAIGPFGSSYFWGGWLGAIFMCIINALVVAILLRVCFSNLQNLFSWLIIFYLIFTFLMCFKETADGGYEQDVMYVVYIMVIIITSKLFNKKNPSCKKVERAKLASAEIMK